MDHLSMLQNAVQVSLTSEYKKKEDQQAKLGNR